MCPSSTAAPRAQFKSINAARLTQRHLLTIGAIIAASGLVLASAGFGATYAWQAGSRDALVLAGVPMLHRLLLAAVSALSLELAKPYAIATALTAARSGAVAQTILLALLALVAVSYSLSAELSLMATLKSDATAWRRAEIKRASDKAISDQWRIERYENARRELGALGQVRGTADVQELTPGVSSSPSMSPAVSVGESVKTWNHLDRYFIRSMPLPKESQSMSRNSHFGSSCLIFRAVLRTMKGRKKSRRNFVSGSARPASLTH